MFALVVPTLLLHVCLFELCILQEFRCEYRKASGLWAAVCCCVFQGVFGNSCQGTFLRHISPPEPKMIHPGWSCVQHSWTFSLFFLWEQELKGQSGLGTPWIHQTPWELSGPRQRSWCPHPRRISEDCTQETVLPRPAIIQC